ncbi:MAG: hypothetical protein Q7T07_14640 [Burkholderiaceae bacterium]|nr:hypothetical protein [Burkholderiaceae bacterium]
MNPALLRALVLVGWSIPACAAVVIALSALLAWLSPEHMYLSFVFVIVAVGVFPWLLLTHIVASKRFGIGWHWLVSAVASLLAIEVSRVALSGVVDIRQLTDKIRSACSMPTEETLSQLQLMAASCGITSWFSIASPAFICTIMAGLLLALAAWAYKRFSSRSQRHGQFPDA